MSDEKSVTLADLVPSQGDVVGLVREDLRTRLHDYLDRLAKMQTPGTQVLGAAFGQPVSVRIDHRVLDALVNTVAPELTKTVLQTRVELASEAPMIAVRLDDVLKADPILRELLDTTGSARAALGSLALQVESGIPADRVPLSLVVWSRMVDAHRRRAGRPPLRRIEASPTLKPETYMTPEQYAIDQTADPTPADVIAMVESIETAKPDPAAFQPPRDRDRRAAAMDLETRETVRARVEAAIRTLAVDAANLLSHFAVVRVENPTLDGIIAAVTDAPFVGERCPRCHRAAPNPNGCAMCNPSELGRKAIRLSDSEYRAREARDREARELAVKTGDHPHYDTIEEKKD